MAEKTEKATPKKLRDARKKGQVAKSQDLPAAFTFITSEAKKTLPMWLSERILGDVFMWGELMAGAILMLVPILLIYSLGTKYLVRGLTAGAVKS